MNRYIFKGQKMTLTFPRFISLRIIFDEKEETIRFKIGPLEYKLHFTDHITQMMRRWILENVPDYSEPLEIFLDKNLNKDNR